MMDLRVEQVAYEATPADAAPVPGYGSSLAPSPRAAISEVDHAAARLDDVPVAVVDVAVAVRDDDPEVDRRRDVGHDQVARRRRDALRDGRRQLAPQRDVAAAAAPLDRHGRLQRPQLLDADAHAIAARSPASALTACYLAPREDRRSAATARAAAA